MYCIVYCLLSIVYCYACTLIIMTRRRQSTLDPVESYLFPHLFIHVLHSLYPFLHSFQVLFTFFFLLYLTFLSVALPNTSSYPPPSAEPSYLKLSPAYHPFPFSSICKSLDSLPVSFLTKRSIVSCGLQSRPQSCLLISFLMLLSGDIELNPGPTLPISLNISHLNTRSAASVTPQLDKPAAIQEFITDYNLDILTLSETWLSSDSPPSVLNSLTPSTFSFLHSPRTNGLGGGLALIYRSSLKMSRIPIQTFSSFESLCVRFTTTSAFSFNFLTIYRPPASSKSIFNSEFATLLEDLATSPSELIITGDFNIHVDQPSCPSSSPFLNLIDVFSLTQHITFPTHISGHTLDLLLTRSSSTAITSVDSTDPSLSDHRALLFSLSAPSPSNRTRITKLVRSFRSINLTNFTKDILSSSLFTSPPSTLEPYLQKFNSTLTEILDKHAPFKTVTFPSRPRKPFITPEILFEKSKRSKLETIYRRSKTPNNLTNFKTQSRLVAKLITTAKRSYFRNLVSQCATQPKKLWSTLDSLLSRNCPPVLPSFISPSSLANSFLQFFDQKITKLCSSLPKSTNSSPHIAPLFPPPKLLNFSPASSEEVRQAILISSNASCTLDTIPTFLLKSCLNSLIHPITTIVNMSLSEGIFPDTFKKATIRPLLKKHNLPHDDLSSYRPISNLNFLSKVLERIIHSRINAHLEAFPSLCPLQSAYRKFHSTETALLCIHNDLLLASDQQKVSALVLLDLSAAFDTIDHDILLTRLNSVFGFSGTALSLLTSYLSKRTQHVSIDNQSSHSLPLVTGIPQGSVLGPLLFSIYTSPISYLFINSPVSFHLYADDTQLYISFSSSDSLINLSLLSSTLDSVYSWLTLNRLSVNPDKTEYLLIGTPQQRSKVINSSVSFHGKSLTPTVHARNLGVEFDSDLSFSYHISNVCRSSFHQIRQLRQIRPSLDSNSAILLANSLVFSKLDYCNSLLYNLPNTSINRLQRVQNSLARAVVPSVKRSNHISPTLRKLHWLPIKQRIVYKIATITFRTLQNKQPSYLSDLLHRHNPSRRLRSSDKQLLDVPFINTALGRRSFSYSAPFIWNSLPLSLRTTTSLSYFTSHLKTFLFPP